MPHPLSRRIQHVLALDPGARALEFDGQWLSWGQLSALSRRIADHITRDDAAGPTRVGILLRNRPVHVAALLGVLSAGGTVVVVNPARGDQRTRADLVALELPVVIGTAEDIATLGVDSPATTVVTVSDLDTAPQVAPARIVNADVGRPGVAVWMLTSGTTGPPKRVELTYDMLAHSVLGPAGDDTPPDRLSSGVAIVNAPLVHVGGVYRTLQCIVAARPFALLPRFELAAWVDAIRRHRPLAASLVPTALRMVLHSDLTRDDLSSLRVVTSGTAPLSAEDADAFTDKFGIPVLTSYAATEFGGGVAGWNLADHRKYWSSKRGSVGRAEPGSLLRVVDESGHEVDTDTVGLLEVKPAQRGPMAGWMRTTDLARIDADGFVWIHGRSDQAIIRGGFKIMPDDIRVALETHPAVENAAVVGRPDDRLGETPVGMVECRADARVTPAELADYLSTRLARYEIPTEIAVVDSIPRTPSGKADLGAVRSRLNKPSDLPSPTTMAALIRARADATPTKDMVVDPATRVGYRELDASSRRIAATLVDGGVTAGTRVGLIMPNNTGWVQITVAITRIGAVLVPLSTLLSGTELRAQIHAASIGHLISVDEFRGHRYLDALATTIGEPVLEPGDILHPGLPSLRRTWGVEEVTGAEPTARTRAVAAALEDAVSPSDTMVIIFTSGSSGPPKGVLHSHGGALAAVASGLAARCITSDSRLYLPMPFFWVGGFGAGILSALIAGATLVTEEIPAPDTTLQLLEAEKVTLFRGWPDQAEALARRSGSTDVDLSSLQPGSLPALMPAAERGEPGSRANLFGMTETFGPYSGYRLDTPMPRESWGSCGTPFDGMEVRITDIETGSPLSCGMEGQIEVRGPHVMQGICGRSREDVFTPDGFYPTGDLGYLDDAGFLVHRGRIDDMFKVNGATVYPSEVQAALKTIDGVENAFVTQVDGDGGPRVSAAVICSRAFDPVELRSAAKELLSSFKVPTVWLVLESDERIPRGGTGKVDAARLRDLLARQTHSTTMEGTS
jgi:acyl-CoA synthetase (AMP-forming)/AMP-acid ligase II